MSASLAAPICPHELQEENAYLCRQLALEIDQERRGRFSRALRLAPAEGIIFAALYEVGGRPIDRARLADLLPMKSGQERENVQIVDVYLNRMRNALGSAVILTTPEGLSLSGLGLALGRAVLALADASAEGLG